jgi:proline dehydrogenase
MMRATLLKLSNSKGLARWVTSHNTTRRMAQRFVAGEELDQAITAARVCNQNGLKVSLDLLGESVTNAEEARRARDMYYVVFDRIAQEKLDANVSLKLTQLGLDLGDALCQELVESIVARAASYGNFVRVDMEGSAYTQRTIDLVKRVRAKTPAVGIVVQAYLKRTADDVPGLLASKCRMRLCKGAYKEPPDIAFAAKSDVDASARRKNSSRRARLQRAPLNFRCCTGSALICNNRWCAKASECASIFRTGKIGFPISCGDWRNVLQT